MQLEEKIRGEVAVLRLDGDLLDENDTAAVRQKITSLLIDGINKIVLDFNSLRRINMEGLDTLSSIFKQTRDNGGDIRLAQIDRQVENIFVKTRLVKIFNTYETVGRALASYMV